MNEKDEFAIINLLFTIKQYESKCNQVLVKIGDNSFGIFFMHYFFLMLINKAISYSAYINNILIINQILQVVLAVSLSYFAIEFAKKIMGKRMARELLGF